ncbi:hypothetical protein HDC92_004358 [Pedobacter sp. AK017]|uniref:hypothetical protein n=1 Tax=Pedobacter sp. AK017 TaxID=2723073 RepID=UPI001620C367|nr:hypothetical protein [Pedobacter sp. AK017]MBB5440655.1 hypothetical protein [Pedobacter sp. AK017]
MLLPDLSQFRPEVISYFNGIVIPLQPCAWTIGGVNPASVRHLYLSHSAMELICFLHFHPLILSKPDNIALGALGLHPDALLVNSLALIYPNAKTHTVFTADTIGKVSDCLVTLWLKRKTAWFLVEDEVLKIDYNGRRILIPEQDFSLSRFEKETGLRSGIHTHKPKRSFTSWAEMIKARTCGL